MHWKFIGSVIGIFGGRARGGNRAVGNVPKNYGESVSLIGAIDCSGLIASFAVRGATDTEAMLFS
ncbi:MAG: hypothetical protein M3209_10940 [Acidobacteriota bacterium]|nr:hypothetical protein [Acidobacteriota bacterium]